MIFIFAVNASFAADENMTELAVDESGEDILEDVELSQDVLTSDENTDELAIEDAVEILSADDEPSIKNGKVSNRYNDGIVYTVNFYDENGDPLRDTMVYCGLNSVEWGYNTTTDSNGVAKFPILLNKGTYTLCLINPQTGDVVNDTVKVFSVLTGNKNINMYYDNGNSYTVRVYGDDGKPVKAGQKVTFYVGNKKVTRKTDKNGYAKLKFTYKPGYYQVAAIYKNYAVSNYVYVKEVIKPLTSFGAKRLKSTFKYKVKYLGKNKKNKKITVKFNKKTYKAKINKKGIAVFTLKTPKKIGSYKVVTSYKSCKVTPVFYRYYA